MAAAGFQPALEDCEAARMARESRLKGGCGQNCPPHIWGRMLYGKNFAALTVRERLFRNNLNMVTL